MGAPKLKKSAHKHKDEAVKETHLKLIKTAQNSLDNKLAARAGKNVQEKSDIKHYQDVISKSLDDPDMVKKAAMLLLGMLEQ